MTDVNGPPPSASSGGSRRVRSVLSTVLGTILSATLLWWLYRNADGPALWRALHEISPWAVLVAAAISCSSIPLRGRQLRLLLNGAPEVTPWMAVRTICLGNLFNNVLPARGGELVKALLLSRWAGLAFPRVLTASVIARALDLGCILVLFGLMFVFSPQHLRGENLDTAMILFGVTSVVGVAALVVLALNRVRFGAWVRARIGPDATRSWDKIWIPVQQALGVFQEADHLWGAVALNVLCWLLFFITPLPLLLALGLEWPQALLTTLGVVGLTTLAHLVPAAPTALGTHHAACLLGLTLWCPEIDRTQALAFTLVLHPVDTLATSIPGLFLVPGSWNDLWVSKRETTGRAAATPAASDE